MVGGRASAVFGETLCLPAGRQGGTFACFTAETKCLGSDLAAPQARYPFLWRPAMQGFEEDPTDPVATRDWMLTLSNSC